MTEKERILEKFEQAMKKHDCVETVTWGKHDKTPALFVFIKQGRHTDAEKIPGIFQNFKVITKKTKGAKLQTT